MGPAIRAVDIMNPQRRPAMATVEPTEYTTILETIRHWPPDVRRGLMNDVLKTLGQLQWACLHHDIAFARSLPAPTIRPSTPTKTFVALNHGESINL